MNTTVNLYSRKSGEITRFLNHFYSNDWSRDDLCPGEDKEFYNTVVKKLLDIGDFIGVEGFVFRTQMGEITVHARSITVLGKSLRPLPIVKVKDGVTYDAFDDPELRYRRRYVDLVVNDGVKEIFIKRTKVYNSMREYFNTAGYMEVEPLGEGGICEANDG